MTPSEKLKDDLKSTFYRWEEESDLFDDDIIVACKKALREYYKKALREYYNDQIIVFDSEIELVGEDEEEEEE
jgi:hypothetical protein